MNDIIAQSFLQWIEDSNNQERLNNYKYYDEYYNGDQTVDIPAPIKKVPLAFLTRLLKIFI